MSATYLGDLLIDCCLESVWIVFVISCGQDRVVLFLELLRAWTLIWIRRLRAVLLDFSVRHRAICKINLNYKTKKSGRWGFGVLGFWGFGTVHLARKLADNKQYAIKSVQLAQMSQKEKDGALN